MSGYGVSAAHAAGAFRILAAGLNGDFRPRLPNGDLVSRRKGFGSTAKLMRKREKQFSKKEARLYRKLMREVQA